MKRGGIYKKEDSKVRNFYEIPDRNWVQSPSQIQNLNSFPLPEKQLFSQLLFRSIRGKVNQGLKLTRTSLANDVTQSQGYKDGFAVVLTTAKEEEDKIVLHIALHICYIFFV